MLLRKGPLTLRAATSFRRRLATSSTAEKEEDGNSSGGLISSWVGKIKGAFQSKAPTPPTDSATPTLIACADELKKLTRVANVASLLKFRRDANQQSYIENLEKVSTIYRALGKHNPTGQNVNAQQKALAAEECKCSVQEVDKALETFERLKILSSKLKQMQEKGEQIPKTVEEMSNLVNNTFTDRKIPQNKIPQSHNTEVGRNSPCTCGSGKKFKRCCGRGT